ncbi:hypothetical protein [Flavobacterium difficile]|uniref:Uncharacterized protein n=1 Tax=Flavobacterium difficile TaxID=2709659 RepID=A0ABX0I414_9FLAO|nr:hypothetical protein [Flavobacterium difficile]NHM00524.1 hypothetical protein [Flavobacterium difficile]
MKQIKNKKFSIEKFEVAKLENYKKITGGTGVGGDPETVTRTSNDCSNKPNCKDKTTVGDVPVRPTTI